MDLLCIARSISRRNIGTSAAFIARPRPACTDRPIALCSSPIGVLGRLGMIMSLCSGPGRRTTAAVLVLTAAAVGACTTTPQLTAAPSEQAQPSPPPAPPPPQPPPIDVAGRWRLAAASGACLMTLAATPGAAEGTIAPAGGCPGNFFTSRKWTFEHDMLIIRDHKNDALAELAFSAGRFQGQATGGGSVTLARP
jgi:Protease inhibitor Inh